MFEKVNLVVVWSRGVVGGYWGWGSVVGGYHHS